MTSFGEIFEKLEHQPIYKLLGDLGLRLEPTARTTLSDWAWKTPSGAALSLWIEDTVVEEGRFLQRHNVKKWAHERAANTQIKNRALRYDLALREIYYKPGREFRVILLESGAQNGWNEASSAARKALDPNPWKIVGATPDGHWTLERGQDAVSNCEKD